MKALLLADNTLPLAAPAIADLINSTCRTVKVVSGSTPVRFKTETISVAETFRQLPLALKREAVGYDYVLICTAVPYDNNYFFDSDGKTIIFSFSGWNLLTDLPVSNGVVSSGRGATTRSSEHRVALGQGCSLYQHIDSTWR